MQKLFIYGIIQDNEISDKYVQNFINNLKENEDFEVYINSPGGNVFQGIAIYNILKPFNPVMKIIGQASSMASVVAAAGRIEIADTAFMLIHNPWTVTLGDSNYHKKVANRLGEIKKSIIKAYQNKTGKSQKELSVIMDEETFYNAKDAVENKFANKIFIPDAEENKALALYEFAALNKEIKQEADNKQLINEGCTMPNFEVENTELKNQVANLTTERNSLKEGTEGLQTKVDELTTNAETLNQTIADKTKEATDLQTELDTANKSIETSEDEKKINDVEIFLARNIRKIKPADMEEVKAELIVLRNHMDLKIGEVSMYDKHCKSIEALSDLPLDETLADKANSPDKKKKINADALDFDSDDKEEIKKCDEAVNAYVAEHKEEKIDYAEAHRILSTTIEKED